MRRKGPAPNAMEHLGVLKDFQRATCDRAFEQLYLDPGGSGRFLVADEVGLGKTLVARGVIAKTVEHLWDKVDRIDIVYICSNADIARQNINRLHLDLPDQGEALFSSRLTLLPIKVRDLRKNKVNFISFTPGTSFDLRSSLGMMDERALLYWLLKDIWKLQGTGPLNVLRGDAQAANFRALVRRMGRDRPVDRQLASAYRRVVRERKDLKARFLDLAKRFHRVRKHIPQKDRDERAQVVSELRQLLAATCIEALEPDLIIVDEFQRFRHLLQEDNEAGQLANELFNYSEPGNRARVLLLSATPYKMYTLAHEEDDDHYRDFIQTLGFLFRHEGGAAEVAQLLDQYRQELYLLRDDPQIAIERLRDLRRQLESRLRRVMSRTERLAVTDDRNGMLKQVVSEGVRLEASDLDDYLTLQRVSEIVGFGEVLNYWKAAPYLLNFMEHYKLKASLEAAADDPTLRKELLSALISDGPGALIPWAAWRAYEEVEARNPRLRALFADTVERGLWRLLWMPPSLPYYEPQGAFAEPKLRGLTKRLIFSGWHVVPKGVASLLSYEAERRMIRTHESDPTRPPENSAEARRRRRPLLRFARDPDDGGPTGMPVLGLLFPSATLALEGDPLRAAVKLMRDRGGDAPPTLEEVVDRVEERMRELLKLLEREFSPAGTAVDEAWYWAAPILLDRMLDRQHSSAWFSRGRMLARAWSRGEEGLEQESQQSIWEEHVAHARAVFEGDERLGAFPPDLARLLALLSVASPAVTALRALWRVIGQGTTDKEVLAVRDAAAHAAYGFRSLFNQPEVLALLRGTARSDEPYWRTVLQYCAQGNMQALLDEYMHIQREHLGLIGRDRETAAAQLGDALFSALTLRTSNVAADDIATHLRTGERPPPNRFRARFAVRFGVEDRSDDGTVTRTTHVRDAFNSPFWPFVLVTTSIGQEGLDFHPYCHAVVHWDLPSNPVDLEQREGRVHRYKGHAVRKNVALAFGPQVLHALSESTEPLLPDPWERAFARAVSERPPGTTDLVPFWIAQPPEGVEGAAIERHVPALPLSREHGRLADLRRSLAVYRMVFGQPRQEDLVEYLLEHVSEEMLAGVLDELRVDLSPTAGTTD